MFFTTQQTQNKNLNSVMNHSQFKYTPKSLHMKIIYSPVRQRSLLLI